MNTMRHSTHGVTAEAASGAPAPRHRDVDHGNHAGDNAGGHGGHGQHGDHVGMFRRRFWWNLLLSLPVVVTAHMLQDWFGYHLDFPGDGLVGPVLGTIIFLYGGWRSWPAA